MATLEPESPLLPDDPRIQIAAAGTINTQRRTHAAQATSTTDTSTTTTTTTTTESTATDPALLPSGPFAGISVGSGFQRPQVSSTITNLDPVQPVPEPIAGGQGRPPSPQQTTTTTPNQFAPLQTANPSSTSTSSDSQSPNLSPTLIALIASAAILLLVIGSILIVRKRRKQTPASISPYDMSPRRRFTRTIRLNASTSQEYLADDSEQIQSAQLSPPPPPPTTAADSLKRTEWPLTMVTNETESDEQIIVMAQKRSFELMRNGSVSPPTQISGVSTLSSRGSGGTGGNAGEDDLVNGGVIAGVVGSGGEERNRRASHALPKLVGIPVSSGIPVGGGPTSPLHQQLQQQLQQQQRSSVTISRGIVSTGTVVVSSAGAELLEHHSSVAHVVSDSTSTTSAISETATPVIGVPVQTVRTGFALVDIDNPITRTGSSKATIVD